MRALLKKDRIWLGLALLAGLGVRTVLLLDWRPTTWWLGAERRGDDDFILAGWLAALALGLYAGLRDRLWHTREYLLQRPVSAARVFWTRCLACLGVLFVAALLPPLVAALFVGEAPIRFWDQLGVFTALSTSLCSLFAAGMYAATVRGTVVRAAVQGLLVGSVVACVVYRLLWPLSETPYVNPLFFAGANALLTGALLAISARAYADGQDPDRPVPAGRNWPHALLLTVSAATVIGIGLGDLQRDRYEAMGRELWAAVMDWEPGRDEIVSDGPAWPLELLSMRHLMLDQQRHAIGGVHRDIPLPRVHDRRESYFVPHEGRVYVFGWSSSSRREFARYAQRPPPAKPFATTLVRGDGKPFSPKSEFERARSGPLLVFDPGDRSLWRLTQKPDLRFVRALKDEDIVGFVPTAWQSTLRNERVHWGVRTPERFFVWRDGLVDVGFENALKPGGTKKTPTRDWKRVADLRDPLHITITDHRPGTATASQIVLPRGKYVVWVPFIKLCSVWQGPALGLWSVVVPGASFDPILASGRHNDVLGWALLASLLLAFFTSKRLARMQVDPATRRLWTILVLLFGLGGVVAARLLVTRRAHRGVETTPGAEYAPLRIHTPTIQAI